MKLGMQVGLGPRHILLDVDPAPPPPMGHSPPIFGPYLLVTGYWQLTDTPTRRLPTHGLDNSRTGYLAD